MWLGGLLSLRRADGRAMSFGAVVDVYAMRTLHVRETALIGAVEGYGGLVNDGAVSYRSCRARFNRNLRSWLLLCLLDGGVALQCTEVLIATGTVYESSTSCAYGARLCAR